MLFMLLLVLLPENRSKLAHVSGYVSFYYWVEARAVAWHKSELERHDDEYHQQQAELRYAAALKRAEDAGIGPLDPDYPTFEEYFPTMAG